MRPRFALAQALLAALGALLLNLGACTVPAFEISDQGVSDSPAHCANFRPDQGETDVDCGGACAPCAAGQLCKKATDCDSAVCADGACSAASCSDQAKNGSETDTDCGGEACPTCAPGSGCRIDSDCAGGSCNGGTCALVCLDGKGNCDADPTNGCEINLKTDVDHCGGCDAPCSVPHATAGCTGGKCRIETCTPPFADCDGDSSNGCETNTSSDAGNCSACGTTCVGLNGTPTCANSECQITCATGYADCDADRANGCEKNVTSAVSDCGACGTACAGESGTPWCSMGKCGTSVCPAGFGDCNADPSDGCEVDLAHDLGNCLSCGASCVVANGVGKCGDAGCEIAACDATHADCNGLFKDGCETNIATDVNNCGTCGDTCSITNGTPQCQNKICKVKTCVAPWADCTGDGTSCQTDTSKSTSNCGGCGSDGLDCNTVYGPLNATGKCVAGGCQVSRCAANFGDCNSSPDTDGCEADLRSSTSNCGACAAACQAPHGSNACSAGKCAPSCGSVFGDCDGSTNSGCEAVLSTDQNNCGGCAIACQDVNASNACTSGGCMPICSQAWFKSCDGNPNNGCEADTRSSKQNCGGCGSACLDNQTTSNNCVNSACAPVCAPSYADCDASRNNGCETPVGSDTNNCGACGVHCGLQNASGSSCGSGSCHPSCNDGWAACSSANLGCTTSIDTQTNCGSCGNACQGATPFCASRACKPHLDIVLVNSSTSGNTTATGQSLSLNHALATASGSYRVVLVGVAGFGNGGHGKPGSVKYNGVPMLPAKELDSNANAFAGIYYLADASLPSTPGSYPVLVTSADPPNTYTFIGNVLEFKGAQQTGGPVDMTGGSGSTAPCSINKPSDALAPSAGDYVYDLVAVNGAALDVNPNASGQIISMQSSIANLGTVAGTLASPVGGATTLTWNLTNCNAWAHGVVALRRAITP